MKIHGLLAALLFGIAVACPASTVHAKSGLGDTDPASMGKPMIPQFPDLVVDSIAITFPKESPCTGLHQGSLEVVVKIRNTGAVAAVMPTWKPWVLAWSIVGGDKPPYAKTITGPSQLAPGTTLELKVKLAVIAKVTPDKSGSSIGIGAIVDPEKLVAEKDEQNNMKDYQLKLLGEFCPPPKR